MSFFNPYIIVRSWHLLVIFILIFGFRTMAQEPKLMLPIGHTDEITIASFSPDGKKIVTGSNDKTVKIWDTQSGRLLADLKGHTGEIRSIFFNTSGSRLLTTSSLDSAAKLWDVRTGILIKNIHNGSSIEFAVFSPDGKKFITSTSGDKPVILSSETGTQLVQLDAGYTYFDYAVFSPDGKKIIFDVLSDDPQIWDTETGKQVATLKGHASPVDLIASSPDGKYIVTTDKAIKVWNVTTGELEFDFPGHNEQVKSLWFSPDGKKLVSTSSGEAIVKLWSLEKGAFVADVPCGDGYNTYGSKNISFSADSKTFIIKNELNKKWDAATGFSIGSDLFHLTFFPDQRKYIVNDENNVNIIDQKTDNILATLENAPSLRPLAFSPEGNKLIGQTADLTKAFVWDTRTGNLLVKLQGFTKPVGNAVIAPDSKYIVVASDKDTDYEDNTSLWKIDQNSILSPVTAAINDSVKVLRYSPDGSVMVQLKELDGGVVSLWNAHTLEVIDPNLKKPGMQNISLFHPGSMKFSDDSKKLFISNTDWGSYILDAKTGELLHEINHEMAWLTAINSSATRFISSFGNKTTLIEISSGKVINELETDGQVNSVSFLGTDNSFLIYGYPNISLYKETSQKPRLKIPFAGSTLNSTKNKIVTFTGEGIQIWDLKLAKLQAEFKLPASQDYYEFLWDAIWSYDEKQILCSTTRGRIKVIDTETGELLKEFEGFGTSLSNSESGKFLMSIYQENVSIYDSKNFSLISQLNGHVNKVSSIVELPDSTKILTVSEDNTAKVWDLYSGKLLYTYLMLSKNHHFNILPTGLYMANPNASKLLHYVTDDLKIISFEQLDVKYNRPDKVLTAIGSTDSLLIESYRRAYEKRIQKLQIDTSSFESGYSVPEADFSNRHLIEFEQKEQEIDLHITAKDSLYALDRFNVWVNKVPLYGLRGGNLKNKNIQSFDTTITVRLSDGNNRIETSITNISGTESYRMPLLVNYSPAFPAEEKLYFIGIGINEFAQNNYNLKWSVKDIRDQAIALKQKYGNRITIDTLFDKDVTVENVEAMKTKLLSSNVNDKVIIAYSGHGMLSKDYDYYLSTYNVNFTDPQVDGLPYEVLENLLDGIPARKKLMLIDACHSGEVDKEELLKLDGVQQQLADSGISGGKGVQIINQEGNQLGMKSSFELMQELFINVGRSTGATIISAAGGTQFAYEKGNLQNGVFSYSILEYMKEHPHATVSALKQYVNKRVSELTAGLQVPTTRNETNTIDWLVW